MHRAHTSISALGKIIGVIGLIVSVKTDAKERISLCHDKGYLPEVKSAKSGFVLFFFVRLYGIHSTPICVWERCDDDHHENQQSYQ